MGVKIFRENNWDRLEAGMISLWDIRGLDREKDRRLIEYLILKGRDRLKEKIMRQYGIAEMPEYAAEDYHQQYLGHAQKVLCRKESGHDGRKPYPKVVVFVVELCKNVGAGGLCDICRYAVKVLMINDLDVRTEFCNCIHETFILAG